MGWGVRVSVSCSVLLLGLGTEPRAYLYPGDWPTTELRPSLSPLFFKDLVLLFLNCVYMCMSPCVYTHAISHRVQKGELDPLELELRTAVSLTWVL